MSEHEAKRKLRELTEQKVDPEQDFDELVEDLKRFERQFGMSTVEFYRKFRAGKMGDDADVIEWAGLYKAYMIVMQDSAKPRAATR
jgi:hypothetical protein